MANHHLDEFILLVVILVLAGAASNKHIKVEAKAAPCSEGLGACGADCQEKCAARHPGLNARGSCDPPTTPPSCTCYFDCKPPAPKTCTGGAGVCSVKCVDQCCDANCASKYKQGRGFCNMLGYTWLCQCEYSC